MKWNNLRNPWRRWALAIQRQWWTYFAILLAALVSTFFLYGRSFRAADQIVFSTRYFYALAYDVEGYLVISFRKSDIRKDRPLFFADSQSMPDFSNRWFYEYSHLVFDKTAPHWSASIRLTSIGFTLIGLFVLLFIVRFTKQTTRAFPIE